MLKWLWPGSRSPAANRDSLPVRNTQNGRAGQNPPSAVLASAAAAEEGHSRRTPHVPDEAPMTPVVYVVLWTSVAVGCLRGYVLNSSVAARMAPSYTYTFSEHHQAEILRKDSPFCTTGVDGLPGLSWYETIIFIVPPVLAPLLGAVYVRSYGRRSGIMLGCCIMLVGQILLASSRMLIQLYLGQALVASASDVLFMSVAMQDIEIAPRNSRGFFLLVHIVGYAFGSCAVAVVGYVVANQSDLGWRLLFAMGTLPALTVLLVTPWLYETPHSLIERGKYAEGWEALREIRGPFYEDTYSEFMSIVRAAAAAPKGFGMYPELFRKRIYRPAIFVGVSMACIAALLDPLSRAYVAYQTLTRSGVVFVNAVLLSSVTLYGAYAVGALLSVVLVDRIGRLPLLRISSLVAATLCAVLVAVAQQYAHKLDIKPTSDENIPVPNNWPIVQLAALATLSAGNGIAWSSAAYVIIFESQSLAVRPAAVAICIAAANLSASVLESRLLCLLRTMYYLLVLAVSALALVVAFWFVPETGRVSLEDISALYAKHWWWGRMLNPKPKQPRKRGKGAAKADSSKKGNASSHNQPPHLSSGAGSNPNAATSASTTQVPSRPDDAAACADDAAARADVAPVVTGAAGSAAAAAAGSRAGPRGASPFGLQDVQLARVLSGSASGSTQGAPDEPTEAEVAAAASIALAGAMSRAASSVPSNHMQHGRGSRKSLRLAGKRRSGHIAEASSLDAVDQLADELLEED